MSPLRAGSITLSYEPLCVNLNPNTWESLHTHSRREGCRRQNKDGQRNRWKEEGRSQAESLSKDTTCSCSLTSLHTSQQHLLWPTHHSITHHSLTRHRAQSQSWFLLSSFSFLPRGLKFQPCHILSCMALHIFLISLSQVRVSPVKRGRMKYTLRPLLPKILL